MVAKSIISYFVIVILAKVQWPQKSIRTFVSCFKKKCVKFFVLGNRMSNKANQSLSCYQLSSFFAGFYHVCILNVFVHF